MRKNAQKAIGQQRRDRASDERSGNHQAINDLDGVLTKTASLHTVVWKLFDGLLKQRAAAIGEELAAFDIDSDHRRDVDGKLRYDGVSDLLVSRGIELPLAYSEICPAL